MESIKPTLSGIIKTNQPNNEKKQNCVLVQCVSPPAHSGAKFHLNKHHGQSLAAKGRSRKRRAHLQVGLRANHSIWYLRKRWEPHTAQHQNQPSALNRKRCLTATGPQMVYGG
eukprot:GHVT01010611.1.p2 GENE.GHVT01010611.1~~GHVT01010611.1.p2  ORF type:complete len:113 (-),score=7.70 GHVT01010611.1:3481-3819(-)